jgi:T-complex protein 1 subunit theta
MELAHRIGLVGAATPGLEQYAMNKFAESLEVVPRILAENSGQVATEVISELYAAHVAGQIAAGVNVEDSGERGHIVDAAAAGILDCLATKLSAMRLACDAAITVLRVDTIIMSKQAGGPKPRQQQGAPDDD